MTWEANCSVEHLVALWNATICPLSVLFLVHIPNQEYFCYCCFFCLLFKILISLSYMFTGFWAIQFCISMYFLICICIMITFIMKIIKLFTWPKLVFCFIQEYRTNIWYHENNDCICLSFAYQFDIYKYCFTRCWWG